MTEYYSYKDHFERPVPPAVFNIEMKEFLEAIDGATKVVQDEELSHLYFAVGEATLGAEKPYETFQTASDRSVDVQTYAQKIHSDIMETIDSKFTKGLDETFETLNDVNGQKKQYTAKNMTYKEQRTFKDNNGNILSYEVDKKYTLSQLLDAKTSPIQATKDVYDKHLSIVREKVKNKDSLTDQEIKMIEGKSEEELVQLYFPTEIGDYTRLKATNWQEKNKGWLAPVETAFRWTAAAVSAIAIVAGSGGTALPAAGAVSSALLIGDTGYSAVTGNTLISGTQLSPEERNWAIAETGATLLSLGANKWLAPLSQMRESTKLGKVASVVGKSDDAVDGVHVAYDVLTKGEEEGASSFVQFALFKGVGLAAGQFHKSRTPELPSSKVGDVDVRYQEYVSSRKASGQEPLSMLEWKTKVRTLEQNKQLGAEFKAAQTENFKEVAQHVENNITIATTIDGQVQKVKVSAIGVDADGKIRIQDYTTKDHISTSRQAILDNISKNGGVIVGKGKGEFVGGIEVPKGTRVDVLSQKTGNYSIEHVSPKVKEATFAKFDELASSELDWNTPEKQASFKQTFDLYAERAAQEGAVPSKEAFYQMYASRQYDYSDAYKEIIKQPYLESGASSVVNGKSIEKFAFDGDYPVIGRRDWNSGIGQGNFVTSISEDAALLYEDGNLKPGTEIATVKGVSDDTYDTGIYQYEYSPELVQSMDRENLIRFPNGDSPGSSSLNIPGAKTWAGPNIGLSESELLMPTLDMRGHSYQDFQSAIEKQGYYEIKNPHVYIPNTSETVQVEGIFRINQWSE